MLDAVSHQGARGDHGYFMAVAVRDGLSGLAALAVLSLLPRDRRDFGCLPVRPYPTLTGRLRS